MLKLLGKGDQNRMIGVMFEVYRSLKAS